MKKLLRPKDVLLLGLAGALDIFEEVKHPLGISAMGAKAIYGWVPEKFQKKNFYRVVDRGLRTGEIEKTIKNGEVFLKLTSAGKEKITREFPLFSKENKWDKRWRVVIFDIKEIDRSKRGLLRDKLRTLGFGMLQESVWITPHDFAKDLREFIESLGLAQNAYVLEVSSFLAGDKLVLLNKIFQLDKLNTRYEQLILDAKNGGNLEELRQEYLQIRLLDPELPKELLPKDWLANMAHLATHGRHMKGVDEVK